jgi:hypothetical protein
MRHPYKAGCAPQQYTCCMSGAAVHGTFELHAVLGLAASCSVSAVLAVALSSMLAACLLQALCRPLLHLLWQRPPASC